MKLSLIHLLLASLLAAQGESFAFQSPLSKRAGGATATQLNYKRKNSEKATQLNYKTEKDTDEKMWAKMQQLVEPPQTKDKEAAGLKNHANDVNDPSNQDYVMVGANRTVMEKDKNFRKVTSEARVWKNFRQREALANPTIPVDVLLERTSDTLEDVFCHLRRMAYEKGAAKLTPEEDASRKTVVVLGSGWAAHALMKVADCQKLRIIVVSPTNHFVFTPMLASASVGTVEYRSMTEAVRAANPMIEEYIEGKGNHPFADTLYYRLFGTIYLTLPRSCLFSLPATGVDIENKKIKVQLNELLTTVNDDKAPEIELDYDHLVVSVGSRVNDMNVPGAREHALRLKSTDDARQLRTAVGEAFEYASRPGLTEEERTRRCTFMIAGGGPTGVELAGELSDLFADITKEYKGTYPKLAKNARVILAHGGADLVPQFEEPLRNEALASLKRKGVQVYLNTRVNKVTAQSATLSVKQFDPESGEVLKDRDEFDVPVGLSIWCAGTAPASFCSNLLEQLPDEARNKDGRVKVDGWMRPQGLSDGSILVLGDAAAQEKSMWDETLLPSTAQVAGQQGAYIARTLSRGYDLSAPVPSQPKGRSPDDEIANVFNDPSLSNWLNLRGLESCPPFVFLNLGLLAYLGGGEALTQVQVGDKNVVSKAGSVGFFLWRSVYLVKQVATRNRVLVTFDWVKSAMFGRDTTRF